MAKYTKTWKIGEQAAGGIITVNITGKVIQIQNKEWDFYAGSRRSSDQSQAEVLCTGTITNEANDNVYAKVYDFLIDITTHYYTDMIIKWIESKIGKLYNGW